MLAHLHRVLASCAPVKVEALCEAELARSQPGIPEARSSPGDGGKAGESAAGGLSEEDRYWVLATLGEAAIIRGDLAKAAGYYKRAVPWCVRTDVRRTGARCAPASLPVPVTLTPYVCAASLRAVPLSVPRRTTSCSAAPSGR